MRLTFHTLMTSAAFIALTNLAMAACPTGGNRVDVTPSDDLRGALLGLQSGGTLALAPGDYGVLQLSGLTAAQVITLCSAKTDQPAVISGMNLIEVSNMAFDGIVFDYTFKAGDSIAGTLPFRVTGGRNIRFSNVLLDGDNASGFRPFENGFPTAHALTVQGTNGVVFENSEVRGWFKGIDFRNLDNLTIRGNNIHSMRSDGLNGVGIQNVLIEGNHFHDFTRSLETGDHADMIQIWRRLTNRATRDVVIRGNILNSGQGLYTQSIYFGSSGADRSGKDRSLWYQDITIENNVIINAHLHGITVTDVDGLAIRNNTILRSQASKRAGEKPVVTVPRINVTGNARRVTITGNITSGIAGYKKQSDWTVKNNYIVQDTAPFSPGYYLANFVAPPYETPTDPVYFQYLPGGPLDGKGLGSSLLQFQKNPPRVTPLIRATPLKGAGSYQFDGRYSAGPSGMLDQLGASFDWRFSDGASAAGAVVTHSFATPGPHGVELVVTLSTGQSYKTVLRMTP